MNLTPLKKITAFVSLLMFTLIPLNAKAPDEKQVIVVEVSNTSGKDKTDAPITLKVNQSDATFEVKSAVVREGTVEIPSQLDDLNNDRVADELAFVADIPANTTKTFKIVLSQDVSNKKYTPRVFAQMLISDKNGKHVPVQSITIPGTSNIYNQLHHHGPAFESELTAYRIYFDQKQTVDIYGKFNKGLEIKESRFYPTDEQLARGFGDDVLMVGSSCGVGAVKGWNGSKSTHIEPVTTRTERIIAYGPVRTITEIEANGWEYQGQLLNMTHRYTLYAGHRDVCVETFFEKPLNEEVFCTGVVDIKGSVSYSDHKGLIACWGTDWPVNDTVKYAKETVGLATYIPQKYVKQEVKDKQNYLYTICAKGEKGFLHHISFTSMKETFGYKTPKAWFEYVQQWKEELEHPLIINIKE